MKDLYNNGRYTRMNDDEYNIIFVTEEIVILSKVIPVQNKYGNNNNIIGTYYIVTPY